MTTKPGTKVASHRAQKPTDADLRYDQVCTICAVVVSESAGGSSFWTPVQPVQIMSITYSLSAEETQAEVVVFIDGVEVFRFEPPLPAVAYEEGTHVFDEPISVGRGEAMSVSGTGLSVQSCFQFRALSGVCDSGVVLVS